ncbi:MAG TPA: IPT/TIG domain-containing protein, partial [Bryobacteraceae bacterium]|nr:IPT/TIG domain-containing protein [Bryobacteraceae bacterium]
MKLRQYRCLLGAAAWALFGFAAANGQTQDTSQNALLKGNYRFRHIAIQNLDANYNPSEVTATFGLIVFDGVGNYTITGTQVDNTVSSGAAHPFTATGTYAIGSNGAGYVSSPLYPGVFLNSDFGAVAQGVFTGSSTESGAQGVVLNDIFIAIPTGTAPTNASFNSAYQTGVLDFAGGGVMAIKNALFKLSANGSSGFGAITLTGQASNQTPDATTGTITQTVTGATYGFNSDGSATLTIPLPAGVTSANALFTGAKTLFESTDGNFILGWTAGGYDIFFGVKALAIAGTNSITKGLYFTAGLEDSPSTTTGVGTDSYYGALSSFGDTAGDGIVHARLNFPYNSAYSYDYGSDDVVQLNADGTLVNPDFTGYQFIFGDAGLAFVGIGTFGNYALVVGTHAAAFSGPGVYLNPIGVVNAASYQPITASLAPGELITLYGTGLSPVTMTTTGGQAFKTTLGGVSVTIDSTPCPIYYVSPTQLAVIVPYEIASNQTGLANIQVSNNGTLSNTVQMYFQDSAPGVFSQTTNGIGFASALHAATGTLINMNSPAQPG